MVSTENQDEFTNKQLSRDENYDDERNIIELAYSIEENDLEILIEFNGIGLPKFDTRFKAASS